MTELFRTSVKQINQFGPLVRPSIGGCPRSWGFSYCDGIKLEPWERPGYLIEGIKHHACCAALVSSGRMPVPGELEPGVVLTSADVSPEGHFGRMARASLRFLPDVPAVWNVESKDFIPWTTRPHGIECEIHLKPDVYAETPLFLLDWKKTSSKGKALRTLAEDVQANVYAYGLMRKFSEQEIPARWVYVLNKTYEAWPVDGRFFRAQCEAWLHDNIDATIELMATFKGAVTGLDLPGDLESCSGVGLFCDHKYRCLRGPVGPLPSRLISLSDITRYKEGKPLS